MKNILILTFILCCNFCLAAELTSGRIVLLQPDESLKQKGIVVTELANYIKLTQSVASAVLNPVETEPASGFLVIAIREGNKSNAWLDFSPPLPPAIELKLINEIRNIPPFKVLKGTVIFAIGFNVNGSTLSPEKFPSPVAWQKVASKQNAPIEVEQLVELVWP